MRAEDDDATVRLRLYVAGAAATSQRARENLERLLDSARGTRPQVEVVDLASDPAAAERDNVIAAPTLVKLTPAPAMRVFGDFTDLERVRRALGIA